jgi:prepilin-type N-terminal cleavage/methylation domain-containing protein
MIPTARHGAPGDSKHFPPNENLPMNRFLHINCLARRTQRGFSIIELLVALIIIGILVTVIVPRLSDRTEDARRTRTRQDLELLSKAQQQVAVDTGFYVRLHLLDNVSGPGVGDGFPPQAPPAFNVGNTIDSLADELQAGSMFGNPAQVFIKPTGTYELQPANLNLLQRLSLTNSETPFGEVRWSGPYLTFQVDSNHPQGNNRSRRTYIGDDAWGNDYLLFLPQGLVLEPQGVIRTTISPQDLANAFDPTNQAGIGLPTTQYNCQVFDRPTILSLGPNGLPGNGGPAASDGFGQGDDIIIQF